jgi:Na+/H+ antiporter NhaD/arsenite permease-like protein
MSNGDPRDRGQTEWFESHLAHRYLSALFISHFFSLFIAAIPSVLVFRHGLPRLADTTLKTYDLIALSEPVKSGNSRFK